MVFGRYAASAAGLAAAKAGQIKTTELSELVRLGYVVAEGLRYEDFLPVSAAGIFASNLSQYGTKSTAAQKPVYTQAQLEEILGRKVVDPNVTYAGLDAESRLQVFGQLGLLEKIAPKERARLEAAVAAYRQG